MIASKARIASSMLAAKAEVLGLEDDTHPSTSKFFYDAVKKANSVHS